MPSAGADMRRHAVLLGLLLAACGTEPTPPPPPLAGKIVFASDRLTLSGMPTLFTMNPDGSNVMPLPTGLPPITTRPDVSPDGDHVAFLRDGIYTMRANGSELRHLLTSGQGSDPRWSPDGTRIAFHSDRSGEWELWIMQADGSLLTQVTNTPGVREFLGDWSPDGQRLAYSRRDANNIYQLWTIRTDGSGELPLTADPTNDALWPAYSPDGAWLSYASGRGGPVDLRAVRSDGTDDHLIISAPDSSVGFSAWSPDGQWIAFEFVLNIALIHPDGTGLKIIADSGFSSAPSWGPTVE